MADVKDAEEGGWMAELADLPDLDGAGWMAELADLSDLDEAPDSDTLKTSAETGGSCDEIGPLDLVGSSSDTGPSALAGSSPHHAMQTSVDDGFQVDTVSLLEGFVPTWKLFHERDDHLAIRLYKELSAFWSGPQLAMAFFPKVPGKQLSSAHHKSAEETLAFMQKTAQPSKGDVSYRALELHLVEADKLCDRRLLPSTDALWCVTLSSTEVKEHSFLVAFNAAGETVRIENSHGSNGFRFCLADWHGTRREFEGFAEAQSAYGRGQWLPVRQWQDTFLKNMFVMLDAYSKQSTAVANEAVQDSLGFLPQTASCWTEVLNPHIVVIQIRRTELLAKPTHSLGPAQIAPASESEAGPTMANFLSGPVAEFVVMRGRQDKCHIAAELHRQLAAQWPKSVWRSKVFLKGDTWTEGYVKSVDKIVSSRKMAKNKKIPSAEAFPISACSEAVAPPKDDALFCVTIGFSESGMGMALLPHPRIFHTFMLYYDAARQAIRTENAWENRYSFAAWRDETEAMKPEHHAARKRFGCGRWFPYKLFFKHFFGQLAMAMESADFVGARDHFENCFGVRVNHKNEVQGNSRYPWLLIEQVVRTPSG